MNAKTLIGKLKNTRITNKQCLHKVGELILKEFNATENEGKAFELLLLAYQLNIPQFNNMLDQYRIEDFKWFSL